MSRKIAVASPVQTRDQAVATFAQELASYRLEGCPGFGFIEKLKVRMVKAARLGGCSFSELWAQTHAAAYKIVDADPRAMVGTQKRA